MKNKLSSHDTFIRALMSDIQIVRSYLQTCIPRYILEKLDLDTLTQLLDTYVSRDLRKSISDIVYSCQYIGGKGEVRISILLEHKSRPDRNVTIQLGSYIFSGWLQQIRKKENLSLIIPVLLYHGVEKWEYHRLDSLFPDIDPALSHYIPCFDYIYHDLGEISDRQLEVLENSFLRASLLVLKHSMESWWLEANAVRLLVWSEDTDEALQRGFTIYLFERSKLNDKKIKTIMETLPLSTKKKFVSTADYLREQGRLKGKAEGKSEGISEGMRKKTENAVINMIREGFPSETICKILEVTPAYVSTLRKQLS